MEMTSQAVKKTGDASKEKTHHPPYARMVSEAIAELHLREGASRQKIKNWVVEHYALADEKSIVVNNALRKAIQRGVEDGSLVLTKGTGNAGFYRLSEKSAKNMRSPMVKKSPKAKKSPKIKKSLKSAVSPLKKVSKTPLKKHKVGGKKKAAAKKAVK